MIFIFRMNEKLKEYVDRLMAISKKANILQNKRVTFEIFLPHAKK